MLLIDVREKFSERFEKAFGKAQIPFDTVRLDYGDYVVIGKNATYGIERKTVSDFIGSFSELPNRLECMNQRYDHVMLLVEGDVYFSKEGWILRRGTIKSSSDLVPTNISIVVFHNFLTSLEFKGVQTHRTKNLRETLAFLVNFYKWAQKSFHNIRIDRRKPYLVRDAQLTALTLIPGVSENLAVRLLDKFGSVSAVCNAELEQLTEIDGIGKKKASEIKKF